jgi:microcystin-dependent protein
LENAKVPDDSSGNFSLVSGYLAVTGQTIQPSQHNPPLEDLAAAMTNRLSRSGVAPMTGPIRTITGSASQPAISPNNNPAIGIYWTDTGVAFAGTVAGTRYIGELIPYTMLNPEPGTVFPVGQSLLRASYPALWAKAQTEIAAGNAWYNNGDGSTTFGIGDMRGCTIAAKDNMGGTAAGRLSTYFSGGTSTQLGSRAGSQNSLLALANLPNYSPTFTGTQGVVSVQSTRGDIGFGSDPISASGGSIPKTSGSGFMGSSGLFTPAGSVSSINGGQTQTAFANVQPTIICNFLLYTGA